MENNLSLIKHNIERFGMVTVMDVTLYEPVTNVPVLELDTLKISSITSEGSTKEIRGGLTADLLLAYDHSRTVNVEIQDALLSMYSLKQFWGGVLKQNDVEAYEKVEIPAVKEAGSVIAFKAAEGAAVDFSAKKYQIKKDDIKIYVKETGAQLVETTDYTFVANEETGFIESITLVAAQGELWMYGINVYSKDVNANGYNPVELVLKSTSFPSTVKMVGRTVYLDQQTGKEVLAEIEIPKLKISPSLTFSMDAEGEASTFDFTGSALVDTETKEIIKMKTLAYVEGILG